MKYIYFFIACSISYSLSATIWQVGPNKTYTYCSQVAPLVQAGDTIQIDAATYLNDSQVQWSKNNLYIVGVGGRPRLEAGSIIANDMSNGKGIFVISGANVRVENIEFANATVQDHNGAGIRQEGANLHVTHCKFDANEMGILCGNIANCKTIVEYSEFINGGSVANPGYQHNIYINHIDSLIFRYNYSHDAIAQGHEFKSRASYNFILYNRIANEQSIDSRTIDIPNGGTAIIMGNVIEQGQNSANSNLLGYGLEGLTNPSPNNVWIVNNTFVNKKTTGSFIHIIDGTDTLWVKNNILAGAKTGGLIIGTPNTLDSTHNLIDNSPANIGFVNANNYDYHLVTSSVAKNAGISLNKTVNGYLLQPTAMYKDTCNYEVRTLSGAIDIGAFEYADALDLVEIDEESFFIYPNPCHDSLKINNSYPIDYIIFDLLGEKIATGKTQEIATSHLAKGLYFLITEKGKYLFEKQ